MITISQAAELIKQKDDIYILTHQFPDGDTLGSAYALCYALQEMGKRAKVIISGSLPKKFMYMEQNIKAQDFSPQFVISVDVADLPLLGEYRETFEGKVDLCIDHHATNICFADYCHIDATAAATTELIYMLIKEMGISISLDMANCIFTGITTDTGCFRYTNTTAQSYRIAADMLDCGCDGAEINKAMFDTKTKERVQLERLVLDSMEFYFDDRCAVMLMSREMIEKSGVLEEDIEGLTALPRQISGVCIGITVREKKSGGYKISVRTVNGYDASQLCQSFGGGGHKAAAGCEIDKELSVVKEMLLKEAKNQLGEM